MEEESHIDEVLHSVIADSGEMGDDQASDDLTSTETYYTGADDQVCLIVVNFLIKKRIFKRLVKINCFRK